MSRGIPIKVIPRRIYGVYVVGFADYVKIGCSANAIDRIEQLQEYAPAPLIVYRIIEGHGRKTERELHAKYAAYRTRGEWFQKDGELKRWIVGGCPLLVAVNT